MNQACLICNSLAVNETRYVADVFAPECVLPYNISLSDTLAEIINKPIKPDTVSSKSLCWQCYKNCSAYDNLKAKLSSIKTKMCNEYKKTSQSLLKHTPVKDKATIVVPASKLQPLPPNFQLNWDQLSALSRASFNNKTKVSTPLINLKVTIGSSVFTQSLSTSNVKQPNTSSNMDQWTVEKLPKDIFSVTDSNGENDDGGEDNYVEKNDNDVENNDNVVENNDGGAENNDKDDENNDNDIENNDDIENHVGNNDNSLENNDGDVENNDNDEENNDSDDDDAENDENEMEIDEDCTVAILPTDDQNDLTTPTIKIEPSHLSDESNYINVNILPGAEMNADGSFVLGKITSILEGNTDDTGDEETIVVNGDSNLLEAMKGHQLVYRDGQIALVMADDGAPGDESADESQIELQVSGDEETANAIIAAANENGGAFIKVEGGDMYRVQSVKSELSPSLDVATIVAKEGNHFKCLLCQKDGTVNTSGAALMMRHLKCVHDTRLYICQWCDVIVTRRQKYTAHIAEHSKKLQSQKSSAAKAKFHTCTVCQKGYNSRTLLLEHMNLHTGTRPYECHICHKKFASKYTHQSHLKIHGDRPRPFACSQCDKSFLSQQNLRQHERTHLGQKDFICAICNKGFSTQHNLEVHGIVHSSARPFQCELCEKSFARRAELLDHHRTHTGERPFACEVCGARFAQRSNLHSHRRATHMDDKRHRCDQCPKRFKRRRLLEYHIKSSHTGERPLKCDVCQSTFVYPEHYKKHIRIHSGERPFVCEICGKTFNSRDNRNTHRFTHSDKKPYECLSCGNSYMRKRQLIVHMNSSGHLAESIVVNQPRVTRVNDNNGNTTLLELNDQCELEEDSKTNMAEALITSNHLELLTEGQQEAVSTDAGLLQVTSLNTHTAQVGDEVLRLVQVKLPDGNDGWVALND